MIAIVALATALVAGPERDNHRGFEAWSRKDTAAALKSFEKAARKDTARQDYAFNLGTAKTLSGKDGESELSRAVTLSKTPEEKARALYNRGTARLSKAVSAPPGQGDPSGAISDLREALKLRPSWNEAARNLDRALRLRATQPPKQCPNPKNQQNQKQDKKDQKNQNPQGGQDQQKQEPQPKPQSGMDPQDAQRLLDGAAAREAQQAREKSRQKKEESDAPDW